MNKNLRLHPKERQEQLEKFIVTAVAQHGISRVTHSHVAKLADVSVSTVHFYFKRREDLVIFQKNMLRAIFHSGDPIPSI